MSYFVGILDGTDEVWGVRIPDLPGCVGGGRTPEEAISNATAALREVAAYRQTAGINLPPPRSVMEVLREEPLVQGEATVMVPLLLDAGRVVRANVSFDAGLLAAIDQAASERGVTRSAFLASAAREKIEVGR